MMDELTEEQKQRIADSLTVLSTRLDEIKHLCTNELQHKVFSAIEEFIDGCRIEDK